MFSCSNRLEQNAWFCFLRSDNLLPKVFSLFNVAATLGTRETQGQSRQSRTVSFAGKARRKFWRTSGRRKLFLTFRRALTLLSRCFFWPNWLPLVLRGLMHQRNPWILPQSWLRSSEWYRITNSQLNTPFGTSTCKIVVHVCTLCPCYRT